MFAGLSIQQAIVDEALRALADVVTIAASVVVAIALWAWLTKGDR